MSTNLKVLKLYKNLLKESSKFTNYNFREYAIRKIKVEFRENLSEKNPINIENLLNKANDSLNLIKRQATISQLYPSQQTVIEKH